MIPGGLVAGHTIANRLFCVRRPFTLAGSTGYHEDEVFDSSFLMSPNEMIRPPKSRMGFLAMTTVLDQAHNTMDRKLFAMKGFHHPGGSQAAFLTGLAHLYNLIPYQRRALNAGKCGVEVEGGVLPTSDWLLNLQILTSGGYRCAPAPPNH
jgi:hypothetical protein